MDTNKLRVLALNEEYHNCFENITDEDFIKEHRQSPEDAFIEVYRYWKAIKNDDVEETFVSTFGEDYFHTAKSMNEGIEDIEKKVNTKYNILIKS